MRAEAEQLALGLPVATAAKPPLAAPATTTTGTPAVRVRAIQRQQPEWRYVDVEALVATDHPVRAVWELVARVDLSAFYAEIKAVAGVPGREHWDPRLLVSLWVWAYSQGVSSAREIERRCEWDPAFQWLTGLAVVNYHTLSDFRVSHRAALETLFTEVLGVLSAAELVTLTRVMHDGTRIRACASTDTFRREGRLQEHLATAAAHVAALAAEPEEVCTRRERAARERAARDRQERLQAAVTELQTLRAQAGSRQEPGDMRVSESDPQARIMKLGDGGYTPAYNAQLSTDAAHGIIVGVGLTQSASDSGELTGAVDRIAANTGERPVQVVADGGFTNRANIIDLEQRGVDFVGSFPDHEAQREGQLRRRGVAPDYYPERFVYQAESDVYQCPAGALLRHEAREVRDGVVRHFYRAAAAVCRACAHKARCCPQAQEKGRAITRVEEHPVVAAFLVKMQTEAAKSIYRQRGPIAEFPNAWLKTKIGLRQFRLRGLVKAGMELLWACLTYNVQQWLRLVWRPAQAARAT